MDIFTIQANDNSLEWSKKQDRLFWRGRDSRKERLDLVLLSKNRSDLIDAGLTNMFFYREKEHLEKYGPVVDHVTFFDFFKVK